MKTMWIMGFHDPDDFRRSDLAEAEHPRRGDISPRAVGDGRVTRLKGRCNGPSRTGGLVALSFRQAPSSRGCARARERPAGRLGGRRLPDRVTAGLGRHERRLSRYDARLKRRVALKLLAARSRRGRDPSASASCASRSSASIDHPNIVPIYEAGTTEDQLFIAMRYVAGRDLGERLQGGRLETAMRLGSSPRSPARSMRHTHTGSCTAT